MLLAIDVGNTRIKSAVFEGNTLIDLFGFEPENATENFKNIFMQYPKIAHLVVSSVGKTVDFDFSKLSKSISVHFISNEDHFPFQNKYGTPQTVGIDRLTLAAGATLLFPNTNRLVIDAGTCVTYDFIDAQNKYWGGAISPGLRLRYESLHQFTAKLPLLTKENPLHFIGNTTNQSIHSGVVNGLIYEIEGFIEQYQLENENFTIILTGGDAEFLAKRLKNTIFANSNFLLESLNQFFQYKINND
ncbi:type III pantothenate kinase [Flavobacterium sp.]|uniref:type III pantothenate kinase n=1 Tax=Flavobacterium sp. TaxID=239 RepID=UPI002626E822|nr:type III pantothenate kinase [Flavobacterium sp.]MDD2985065.1 type III pantothenate kinase [Flavobacterium sp.]